MGDVINLFDRLADSESGRRILDMMEESERARVGTAAQQQWSCEDGWLVTYTTSRVKGGPHDGKFVMQVHKPVGPGARTGKATRWVEVHRSVGATRKTVRKRALAQFKKHSPRWAAKHPNVR